jgi:glucosamine--fructose-6-phosphate aminotransferase (isomerizing)
MTALRRLEYRGYDSAGIATLERGRLVRRRAEGKLARLEEGLRRAPLGGRIGIGHTRWATHGRPTESNAHPHATGVVAVVHNGIIENFRELKQELEAQFVRFESETDTEVVAHLVTREMTDGLSPQAAVMAVLPRLRGAFALVFLFKGENDLLIGARKGSPLAVGHGRSSTFFGSDAIALAPFTDLITYLEEGDVAVVRSRSIHIFDSQGLLVERRPNRVAADSIAVERGDYPHFMVKEIHEQPDVIGKTLAAYVDFSRGQLKPIEHPTFNWRTIDRVTLTGCGTAFYAAMVAKYWFERFAQLSVEIDIASELRYRNAPARAGGLVILISQSGETADTLACLRLAKAKGQGIAAVLNVTTSTMARESDVVVPIFAGPEIGVASTKAFTCQLSALLALALQAAQSRGTISQDELSEVVDQLGALPSRLREALLLDSQIRDIARQISGASDVLYLGRGTSYPLALEGALKLKEISYIHAEGFAAGELKHGPIALIDDAVPVVVIAPSDDVLEKTVSNVQEVAARGGRIIMIGDERSLATAGASAAATLALPRVHSAVAPILCAVPLQLLAYHVATHLGKDVDQPRNLAKSVTVE